MASFFSISIYAKIFWFIGSIELILNLVAWQCRAVAGTVASLEEVCGFDCNKGLLITTINSRDPADGEMKGICCLDNRLIMVKCDSSCVMVNSNAIMYS